MRTCVGCGARDQQATLARMTVHAGVVVADGRCRAPGRGAYLHRELACWREFVRRRGPIRSLRFSPTPRDREAVVTALSGVTDGGAR